MNINRQFLARSVLAVGAVLRIFDPAPVKQSGNYELQVKAEAEVEKEVQEVSKSKSGKTRKLRLPFARGRQRRPYIQFEDGSYKVL